jgi:4-hydroxy-2-oxoheptanedioate aldolase
MRVLDVGAQGVVVPLVDTAADAERAVDAARYPPLGHRSWGPIRPFQEIPGFAPDLGNRRTLVILQVESVEGVGNLDAIVDVAGVDGVMVGPNDLTLSAGGAPTMSPAGPYRDLILNVASTCKDRGVVAGIFCGSVEIALRWRDVGFDMLAIASDAIFMREAAMAAVARMRGTGEVSPRPPGY